MRRRDGRRAGRIDVTRSAVARAGSLPGPKDRATAASDATAHEPLAAFAPVRPRGDAACELRVSVVPNAKATAIDGLHDGALRVRLAAPPVDGKANAALTAWLADVLDLPRRAVTVRLGTSSRRKALAIDAPAAQVSAALRARMADPEG